MSKFPRPGLAHVQILAGALLLSSGASVIKAVNLSVAELAGWRAVVIAGFLIVAIRPGRACWDRSLLPAALAHAVTTLLFMWGNRLTSAATAIFLQYSAPLYLLLLGPWLLREPVNRRDVGVVVVIALGMALLLAVPATASRTASNPDLGGIVAAACGLAWAFTTVTMRGLSRREPDGFPRAIAAVIAANLALAAGLLPFVGVPETARAADWLLVGYMGVFQLGLAFILISLGLRKVTALEGALLLLLEPILNPFWAWGVHGEVPGHAALAGGALILAASVWRAFSAAPSQRPAKLRSDSSA